MARRINDPLIDVLTRRQVLLERLKSEYSKNYTAKVIPELDRAIRSVLSSLDPNEPLRAEMTLNQLDKTIAKLNARQAKVYDKFIEDFTIWNKDLAFEASTFESKLLTAQAVSGTIVAVPSAATAYKLASTLPMRATGSLLEPFLKDWQVSEIRKVEGAIRLAYSEGRTNGQLLRDIRGTKSSGYTDGLLGRNDRDAKTIIRTSVQHVSNTARMAAWEDNSDIIDGYRIIATLDGKTSAICRSLDNKFYKLGEGPMPPLHPNCRTTTVPVLKEQYRSNNDTGTRSSQDGYVSGSKTYYEWLKGESYEFQKLAIGPTRAKLMRDGGMSAERFARLNLGRNFEPLTLAEMRKIDPAAFERAGL